MQIHIYHCLEGAKKAHGLTVLFDVFRASNTIIASLTNGAEFLLPVGDLEDAYHLKQHHPNHLLLGERNGVPPEGFDGDNSPAKAAAMDLQGKAIILTTSAGSQGIVHATQVDQLLIGSFANAEAIARYIRSRQPEVVSLLAIGLKAAEPAYEDEACARYLQDLLTCNLSDFQDIHTELMSCEGADRLRRLHQTEDLKFCTTLNSHSTIPVFDPDNKRIIELSQFSRF